ncbi:hypothetical protein DSM25558_4783 [Agrobacterium sp. DSM 25558]|nr:hypothetical protein DSM25558_4783 [Agrobacterium sp. DSM 25558]
MSFCALHGRQVVVAETAANDQHAFVAQRREALPTLRCSAGS